MKDLKYGILNEDGEYVSKVFLRSGFNYDMDRASEEEGLKCEDETRTQQQFKEECDINTIVERFGVTGELPQGVRVPEQGEFADDVNDYQTALNKLIEADDAFMQMPAKIRAEFQNDAGKFVEFVSDKANLAKMREWGLAKPEPEKPEPFQVRVIADPVAGGQADPVAGGQAT